MDKQPMSPVKGLIILLAVVVVIAGFIALSAALGLREPWAGFLFLLAWSLIEEGKPERLAKSASGALVGTGVAAMMTLLPPAIGTGAGMAIFLGAVLLLVYAFIMQWLPLAVNAATMVFLTAGTIPYVSAQADVRQLAYAIVAAVAYFGGLALAARAIGGREAAPA